MQPKIFAGLKEHCCNIVWQFSVNPHTPRAYGKLPNLPNIAPVSQNRGSRKKNSHFFGFFPLVYPEIFFMGFASQNILLAANYPNFYQMNNSFPKNPNSKYQGILKSPWDSVTHGLGSTLKNLTLTFLPQIFFLTSPHVQ